MIVGVLVGKKMYLQVKYMFTMMIVVGVALIMYKNKAGKTSGGSDSLDQFRHSGEDEVGAQDQVRAHDDGHEQEVCGLPGCGPGLHWGGVGIHSEIPSLPMVNVDPYDISESGNNIIPQLENDENIPVPSPSK